MGVDNGDDRNGERTRQQILEIVASVPGIHKSGLQRRTGVAWGTISHHIRVLRRHGRVRQLRTERELLFFPAAMDDQEMRLQAILRHEGQALVIEHLRKHPGDRIQSISRAVRIPRNTLRRYLATMDDQGIVVRSGPQLTHFHLDRKVMRDIASLTASTTRNEETGARTGSPPPLDRVP